MIEEHEILKRKKNFEEREKKRRERDLSDLRKLLNLAEGRRFVWRILEEARVFASCYDNHNGNMAWKEGRRDLGLMIWNDVTLAWPEKFIQMKNERRSESESDERENKEFEQKLKGE